MLLAMIFSCKLGLFKQVLVLMQVLQLQFILWDWFLKIILMQLSLLILQMHLILLTVKPPCTISLCCVAPSFSTIIKNTYFALIWCLLLVKMNLHPLKVLLRVIHLPWLCMPLQLPHWSTHFVTIRCISGLVCRWCYCFWITDSIFCWWKQLLSLAHYIVAILIPPKHTLLLSHNSMTQPAAGI